MRRVILFIINNILVNRILVLVKKDHLIRNYKANWTRVKYDGTKSPQENVGFSHNPKIDDAIKLVHQKLINTVNEFKCEVILDIGCGTGLYLKDFGSDKTLFGTDLSVDFIEEAKRQVPTGNFATGDFMKLDFSIQFDLIYSISVIEYIPPSQLKQFFEKIQKLLKPGGVVFIQYPHALSFYQTLYPDLSYIQYAPRRLEKSLPREFEILSHVHSYDNRKMKGNFDSQRYDPELEKSFRNGAILIAQKSL